MSKQRYINTQFWTDDYVNNLDSLEKLLFIYLLTNPFANLAGLYELPLKHAALETGIEKDMFIKMLERFTADKKVAYYEGFICIKNFTKHQATDNPKIAKGIELSLQAVPDEIKRYFADTLSIPYLYPSIYSNSNSNSNYNSKATKTSQNVKKERKETELQSLVNHFFALKGWDVKEKRAIYARFTKPAKDLLGLTGDLQMAKTALEKIKLWAESKKLDWSLETAIKRFPDLAKLPTEAVKKPYFDGQEMYQRGNKYFVIGRDGEHREFAGKKTEIQWN